MSILLTDDQGITAINRDWLHRDRPTDVIAFSQLEGHPFPGNFIGDVVISVETADRNARALGHSLDHELNNLLAHGVLHLLGHDHVRGAKRAAKMRGLQKRLVAAIEAADQSK
ncbi:MAG TPA: rRNA maturation RNase YbeY [bacterium]|nr:rRNA maturation RNase YbeY [bacterium]